MAIKISDIAKQAGVSIATVSMALNNKPGISDATKGKILETAEQCGYLRAKKSPMVRGGSIQLLFMKNKGNLYPAESDFDHIFQGIQTEAQQNGYELLVNSIEIDMDLTAEDLTHIHDTVDGTIIIANSAKIQDITLLISTEKPVLLFGPQFSETADIDISCVSVNNFQAMRRAINYLVEMGHREIGYIQDASFISKENMRYTGYKVALQTAGCSFNYDHTVQLSPDMETAYHDMKQYLSVKPTLPTAFLSDNDIVVAGAMRALKEYGLRVPQDISLIGFNDMPFCTITDPPLTTIGINKQALGKITVRRLFDMIADNTCHTYTFVSTKLVKRGSAASPHHTDI